MTSEHDRTNILAMRAGRERTSTMRDVWRGATVSDLLRAQAQGEVGEEFAATREIRRRERARRHGR